MPALRDDDDTALSPQWHCAQDEYGVPHLDAMLVDFMAYSHGDQQAWLNATRHYFRPPEWFDPGLDPYSAAYAEQQDRLWSEVTGRDRAHDAHQDEQTPEVAQMDWRTRPGLFGLMVHEAADQLLAMGQILKHSQLHAGARLLEYGPGFGQIALSLARMGVHCSVVDVNPHFLTAIERQAEMYGVHVKTTLGEFGDAPPDEPPYNIILFYEAFHHSRDPIGLLRRIKPLLAEGGRIMLAGEPILPIDRGPIFAPWGLRGSRDAMAVMRWRGWYEGGFDPDWLGEMFAREGFRQVIHEGAHISPCATVHEYIPDAAAPATADAFSARWRARLDRRQVLDASPARALWQRRLAWVARRLRT